LLGKYTVEDVEKEWVQNCRCTRCQYRGDGTVPTFVACDAFLFMAYDIPLLVPELRQTEEDGRVRMSYSIWWRHLIYMV